jgi:hypothetical protein
MKISDINGQLVSLATTGVAILVAVLTAFHIVHWTADETNTITPLAIAGIGVGLYVYSIIHSWATSSYDLSRVTTLITAAASALMAFLTAFGVFNFDQSQQAAVLGLASGLAFVGGLVFSYLHTAHQVALVKAAIRQSQSGVGSMRVR